MGRQIYLYAVNYNELKEAKTTIIEIVTAYFKEAGYYGEQTKIDLAKLDDPSTFTVAEMALLQEILEENYYQANPKAYIPKPIGFTQVFATSTTKDSNDFMELLISLYPGLPVKYNQYIYYPLYKKDILVFFNKIKHRHYKPLLPLSQLSDDVYFLFDSY